MVLHRHPHRPTDVRRELGEKYVNRTRFASALANTVMQGKNRKPPGPTFNIEGGDLGDDGQTAARHAVRSVL